MRWAYWAVVILFAAIIAIFAFQNLQSVTMNFLGFSVRGPIAVLTIATYLLGAITGTSLFALLRRSVKGARSAGTPA